MAPVETSPVAVKNLALDSFSFMRKSQESDPIPLYTASSKGSDQKTSESKSRKKSKGLMKSRKRLSKGIKRALKTFSSSGMTSTLGSTSESEHKREIEVVMPLQEHKQSNCSNNRGIIVKKAKKHVKKRQNQKRKKSRGQSSHFESSWNIEIGFSSHGNITSEGSIKAYDIPSSCPNKNLAGPRLLLKQLQQEEGLL